MKFFAMILTILLLLLALTACGGDTGTSVEKGSNQGSQGEELQQDDKKKENEYYFKDNVLQTRDVKITITDYKVIPVGGVGNEYGASPVIAFWYNTTNLSDQAIDPMTAWIVMFEAIQDNDPNLVNTLNVGSLPDAAFLDSQIQEIKKNGTVANAVSYELDDLTTPVILRATRGIGGETLGEQTYTIAE